MNFTLLPKSSSGRLSAILFLLFFALGAAGSWISNSQGNTIEYPNPFNSPLLGSIIYLTFLTAGAAAFFGLKAIRRSQERSLLVYGIILIGGTLFTLAALMLIIGTFQSI